MECPYCGQELTYVDYFSRTESDYYHMQPSVWTEGSIYQCENEDCNSKIFNGYFYTDNNDSLHEGYPY